MAEHQEKLYTRNYSTEPCDSLTTRERNTLLLQPISLPFYIPLVTVHPFLCTLLLLCTSPISVHSVVTVHFPYLCDPVVTVHFPLSLYTLLLLCTSPYLCAPCCYCAFPLSLYTLLLLCTSPISVHPVLTVHFPYLCTPCCYCAFPLSLCTLLLPCTSLISVHPVVTVLFPYLCTPCCYCALPLSLCTLFLLCTSLSLCTSQSLCTLLLLCFSPISVHPVVTAHLSPRSVVIAAFNVTYIAPCPKPAPSDTPAYTSL